MGGGSRGTGSGRRRLRGAQRRAPALGASLCALALGLALVAPAPARADGRIHGTVAVIGGGASNAWLEPGPQVPEGLAYLSPGLWVAWRNRHLGVDGGYAFLGTRYLGAQVTGLDHAAWLGVTGYPGGGWRLRLRLGGELTRYDATGPTGSTATLPILATASDAGSVRLAATFQPGALGLHAAWIGTLRHSDATLAAGSAPTPVDETDHAAVLSLRWRPGPRTEVRLGPLLDLRLTSAEALAYAGYGLRAAAWIRAWRRGRLEVAIRVQANRFQGTYARTDLFARLRVGLSQRVGRHVLVRITYAYTANGSDLAAFDADRHLVLVSVRAGTDLLRF